VPREYTTQCWSCLGEFDAAAAVWCTCSARTPSKLCPFCFRCFCQADAGYRDTFWRDCPEEIREERDILQSASGTVGEALIRSNLLNTGQLIAALKWQRSRGASLEDALVDLGFVSRENLALMTQGSSKGDAATVDLSHQLIDASLVEMISVELCHRKKVLPISKEMIGETPVLTLAMAGPTDVEMIDQIQSLTGCRIIPLSVTEKEILDRLLDLFPDQVKALRAGGAAAAPAAAAAAPPVPSRPTAARAAAKSPRGKPRRAAQAAPAADPLQEITEIDEDAAPAARPAAAQPAVARPRPSRAAAPAHPEPAAGEDAGAILQKILADGIGRKASLVQIEIRGQEMSLFFRIDGNLFRAKPPALESPRLLSQALVTCAALPAGDTPACGHLTVKTGGKKFEVVVRRMPFKEGESLLLRVINPETAPRDLQALGASALDRDRIARVLALPQGLVLLSGPPYNEVALTRHAFLSHLAREGRRILAIEAPQLLPVEGVRQVEIPYPAEAEAARKAIASVQGAEVLFLPDIENPGLAALALDRAATGLVIASIQARRASQAPAALLWHQIDAAALATALKLVINQRLVRRICEGCRAVTDVADRVLKLMGLTSDEALDLKVSQGAGCERCSAISPGYSGRVALYEVMEGTPEVAALIGRAAPPGEIEREARRAGMSPLRADCLAAIGQGITTLEEFQKGNF
jgi:type IV pilus assembly protein PilB